MKHSWRYQSGACVRATDKKLTKGLVSKIRWAKTLETCKNICSKDPECVAFYTENGTTDLCYSLKEDTTSNYLGGPDKRFSCYIKEDGAIEMPYVGCFEDKEERDLPNLLKKSSSLDVEKDCFKAGIDQGFTYVGLQNGDECWGGNEIGKHGKKP